MKVCTQCGVCKEKTEFYIADAKSGRLRGNCKKCSCGINSEHRRNLHIDRRRNILMKNKYGISLEQFHVLLDLQGGVCNICKSPDPGPKKIFAVDHDHRNGKVRGLLCYKCNMGLGSFDDNPRKLANAIEYLRNSVNV